MTPKKFIEFKWTWCLINSELLVTLLTANSAAGLEDVWPPLDRPSLSQTPHYSGIEGRKAARPSRWSCQALTAHDHGILMFSCSAPYQRFPPWTQYLPPLIHATTSQQVVFTMVIILIKNVSAETLVQNIMGCKVEAEESHLFADFSSSAKVLDMKVRKCNKNYWSLTWGGDESGHSCMNSTVNSTKVIEGFYLKPQTSSS